MKIGYIKRITSMMLSITLLCMTALAGCAKKTDAQPESTEAPTAEVEVKSGTTIEDGILLVGISSSPYIDEAEDGKVEGFEIDLAKAIGELTFLEVKFVRMNYSGIYAELDTSSFDCIISGVEISDAVDKVYDFSVSYYTDDKGHDIGAVVKSGNNRLLNVLNKSISILKSNGTMDELCAKWFVTDETDESTNQDSNKK